MLTGLLVVVVLLAAIVCPLMMWLGRRGIGPGCAIMGCTPQRDEESLESLRAQHDALARRLEALEAADTTGAPEFERV